MGYLLTPDGQLEKRGQAPRGKPGASYRNEAGNCGRDDKKRLEGRVEETLLAVRATPAHIRPFAATLAANNSVPWLILCGMPQGAEASSGAEPHWHWQGNNYAPPEGEAATGPETAAPNTIANPAG